MGSEQDFEKALAEVEAKVNAFSDAAATEATSQAEKNNALYAALGKAFAFHKSWASDPAYEEFLQAKQVKVAARGAKSSPFTPTIKAFFDSSWDQFAPNTEAEKQDKARRQKAISTYSAVLDYADHSRANDVASFIATEGGIEAARVKWKAERDKQPDAVDRRKNAKEVRDQQRDDGLEKLKKGMTTALPADAKLKGKIRLAAVYFDDSGVANFLGLPSDDEGSKALLEKFLLSHGTAPAKKKAGSTKKTSPAATARNDLEKLLALLSVGIVADPKDANVWIKNGKRACEVRASHGSSDTCIVNAKLPHQDYLPEGAYWFGAIAVSCLKKLSVLGRHGAKFVITGPSKVDGIEAAVAIQITNYQASVSAVNAKNADKQWDWREAIPHSDMRRFAEADGVATITYVTTMEKMARIKQVDAWDGEAKIEGDFATWLQSTFGISKKDPNQRLVKAISDGTRKTTTLRISDKNCTVLDSKGDVTTHAFSSPIGPAGFTTELTVGSKDILSAISLVKTMVGCDAASISMINKLLCVSARNGSAEATVFIPSIGPDGRYRAYTEFDQIR